MASKAHASGLERLPAPSWDGSRKAYLRAWEILVIEFADKRELMDELLVEIDNYGTVKGASKSLGRFATSVSVFVSNMEDNGCPVQEVGEAPFLMSKLLSKLELKDNADFGREMQR